MKILEKIKQSIKTAAKKGFFDIMIGNTLVKCITFLSAFFVPRILTKAQYGVLTNVDNLTSYFLLINGLGLANVILRYCSLYDDNQKKKAIFKFSLKWSIVIDLILATIMLMIIWFSKLPIEAARWYLVFGVGIPLVTVVFESILMLFRASFRNREFATLSIIFSICSASLQILLAWQFDVFGAILGRYLAYAIGITAGIIFLIYKNDSFKVENVLLSVVEKKEMFKFAISAMIANGLSLIMPLNEQFMVTLLIKNNTVVQTANYKAASLGPSTLQFITLSIIVFAYPYFARNSKNGEWIWSKFKQMTRLLLAFMAIAITILIIFTPQITKAVFSEKYNDAIFLMRFMWITFGINSIFRMPAGNILAAIGEVKFNVINAASSCTLHFVLDYIFISKFGINGAAWALTIVYALSSVASFSYLKFKTKKLGKGESS